MRANRNYESILKSFVYSSGREDNESQGLLLYRALQIIRSELKLVKRINIILPTSLGGTPILGQIRDVRPEWVTFSGRKPVDGCKFLTKNLRMDVKF